MLILSVYALNSNSSNGLHFLECFSFVPGVKVTEIFRFIPLNDFILLNLWHPSKGNSDSFRVEVFDRVGCFFLAFLDFLIKCLHPTQK